MKMKLGFLALLLPMIGLAGSAGAEVQLELLAKTTLASDLKFKGTRVGGLSGLVYDPDSAAWLAVSDDRGRNQEPRFYKIDLRIAKKDKTWDLAVDLKDVHFVHVKGEKRWKKGVLDLEGITLLPWGNLLLSSEGDNNKKPRTMPVLLDVKLDGTWARDFALPDEVLPETTGEQTKGIRNNMGPEGLTGTGDGKIWTAIEAPLLQDAKAHRGQVRIIQYEMPEAWVIKPTATYFYPLEKASDASFVGESGVAALFWLQGRELVVMERGLEVSTKGVEFLVKLFHVTLGEPDSVLKKVLILDLKKHSDRLTNFEALAVGPTLPDGRKTMIAMSDNNFLKNEKTEFWIFALGTEKK